MSIIIRSGSTEDRVRSYLANVFIALCVMAVGIGYLGNYVPFLPWSDFTLFFPGWGSLFLIVPGIWGLIRHPFSWFWLICTLAGVLILLKYLNLVPFATVLSIGLAVLLVLVSLRILFDPLIRRCRRKRVEKAFDNARAASGSEASANTVYSSDGSNAYDVSFGSRTVDMSGHSFNAATVSCSFGEMTFDLRGAAVQDSSVLDVSNSFGSTTILLPEGLRVELTRHVSFGSVNNRYRSSKESDAPVLYVNADCSFGEVDIR